MVATSASFLFTAAQGIHGQGGRAYRLSQTIRLLQIMERTSRKQRITVEQIALQLGLGGRTVRQMLYDLDGVAFLLGERQDGVFVCTYADEADRLTRRLSAQVKSMQVRIERRQIFSLRMTRQQMHLWPLM